MRDGQSFKDGVVNEIALQRAGEIRRLHEEIIGSFRMTLDKAIRVGELLTEQKASLGHGAWLPWIRENCPFAERTARDYMRFWERREELKTASLADLAGARRLLANEKETDLAGQNRAIEALHERAVRLDAVLAEALQKIPTYRERKEGERPPIPTDWNLQDSEDTIILLFLRQRVLSDYLNPCIHWLMDVEMLKGDDSHLGNRLETLQEIADFNRDFSGILAAEAFRDFEKRFPALVEAVLG